MQASVHSGPRATAAACAAVVAFLLAGSAIGEGVARYQPGDGERTLLVLPAALARSLPSRAGELPSRPDDWRVAARRADEYLKLARTTGDPRYFGRARATIAPWLDQDAVPLGLDVVAADLAQQGHQFAEARRRLDRALASDPRNPEARLMRANLALLAGEFAAARIDCRAVLRSGSALAGTICLTSAMTGPGTLERARQLLAALEDADRGSTALSRWRLTIQADLALRANESAAAVSYLERAHALDLRHEETRVRLARVLLERGETGRALALSAGANASAALLLVRMRAAESMNAALASRTRRDLEAVLAVGRRRGAEPHLREEAELALHADRDPRRALALARRNFSIQKDTPDLRLLLDAALAARDGAALRSIRQWLDATGFQDRLVDARLREAGA